MKLIIISIAICVHFISIGQLDIYNHWSLSAKFGANKGVNPYASGYYSNTIGVPSFQIGARYMVNPFFGYEAQLGFNQLKSDNFGRVSGSKFFKTNSLSFSGLAVSNLGQILQLNSFAPRLGCLMSAGVGLSSLFNDSLKLLKNNESDQLFFFQFNLAPQIKLSNRISLIAELSLHAHLYQDLTFDMSQKVKDRGIDGMLLTGTFGVNYSLGKKAESIEWLNPQELIQSQLIEKKQLYDSLVSNMKDGDNDGVPDYLDIEANSDPSLSVNTHGVNLKNKYAEENSNLNIDSLEFKNDFIEFPNKLELFYTVQVGYFEKSDSVDYPSIYGIDALKINLPNGAIKYLYGFYDDFDMAESVRDVIFTYKIPRAFVAAYYKGKRITIEQAEKLVLTQGKMVLYAND